MHTPQLTLRTEDNLIKPINDAISSIFGQEPPCFSLGRNARSFSVDLLECVPFLLHGFVAVPYRL